MNVVIWARVSSREQREGYSIDAQLRANRDRAAKHGWTVVKEFVCAESAKRGAERRAFNDMFKWVKKNARKQNLDAILSHKLDRVCRNIRDAVRLQELEDDTGVELAFVENQFGPGAAGMLSFNVMAAVAQYYSDNLRTEVLKGMDEKVRQGWPTGHAPYGYLNVDDKNEPVIPHPEKSKTLQRIFELYGTGQYTFKQLADKLLDEGHVYQNCRRKFHRGALSYILNNRFYLGEIKRNGVVYQGRYQIVITRAAFDSCQRILNGKNRRTSVNSHMLNGGLIRCKCCGFAMTGETIKRKLANGGVRLHTYYRCANNEAGPEHPKVRWREDKLEEAIIADLASLRITDERAEWFRKALRAAFADVAAIHGRRMASLNKRKSEIATMQDRLLNAYLVGTVEEEVYQTKLTELKREIADIDEALETAPQWDPETPEKAMAVFDFSQTWSITGSVQTMPKNGRFWRRSV